MTNAAKEVKTKSVIQLDKAPYASDYQKEGTLTIQLRQTIKTESFYPAKKAHNEMSGGLFGADEFNFGEGQSFTSEENRVFWENVPATSTQQEIEKRIAAANANGACLYRVLSNKPIVTPDDSSAINNGITTMDNIANRQVIRYPDGSDKAGQVVLDNNNKPQYRRIGFSLVAKEDVDNRTAASDDFYVSPEISAELQVLVTQMEGQKI